jgi:hypothetical protein
MSFMQILKKLYTHVTCSQSFLCCKQLTQSTEAHPSHVQMVAKQFISASKCENYLLEIKLQMH